MYLYLYDSFLSNKKFSNTLARIETRLTDLGIGGKICRLSPLRNVRELLAEEIRNGVKTVVVVGNDKTLSQVINIVTQHNITVGLIPIGPNNAVAQILGIPTGVEACDVLAARIVEKIDLGKINNFYFLSGIKVDNGQVTLECESQYKVIPQKNNNLIGIYNLRPLLTTNLSQSSYFNPKDGFLEIFIQPLASGFFKFFKKDLKRSIIPFKRLVIKSKESTSVITDGQQVLKTPVKIEIIPKKLKLIVGKKRMF